MRTTFRVHHAVFALLACVACNSLLGTPDPALRDDGAEHDDAGSLPPATTTTTTSGKGSEVEPDGGPPCETADLKTSSDHCGACGHSCQGGRCSEGICQPVRIAGDPTSSTGLFSLYAMTVVNHVLFGTNWYASAGLVYKYDPSSGDGLRFIVPSNEIHAASPITTDGSEIFYVVYRDQGVGLWTLHPNSLNLENHRLASNTNINSIVADDKYVYFTISYQRELHRIQKDGANELVVPLSTPGTQLGSIAAGGGSVYVATNRNEILVVDRESLGSQGAVSTTYRPVYITLDAGFVYWFDGAGFWRHQRARLDNPDSTEITPNDLTPVGPYDWPVQFLVDDANVWSVIKRSPSSQILRFPKGGGHQTVVGTVEAGDFVFGMATDESVLYFGTYGGGHQQPPGQPPQPYSAIYKLVK